MGRLGTDFKIELEKSNDSIFEFKFWKIENAIDGDNIIMGYGYPEFFISKMKLNHNGKIIDIKVNQTIISSKQISK